MKIKLNESQSFRGLGILYNPNNPTILYTTPSVQGVCQATSPDGFEFEKTESSFTLYNIQNNLIQVDSVLSTRISPIFKDLILFFQTYPDKNNDTNDVSTYVALSKDGSSWQTVQKLPEALSLGLNVENYVYKNQHVFYFGGHGIRIGLTDDGTNWQFVDSEIVEGDDYEIDYTLKTTQGIFVLYHRYIQINSESHLEVKAICFDKDNPVKVLWHTKSSLWHTPPIWAENHASCLGCTNFQGKLLSYWDVPSLGLFVITYPVIDEVPPNELNHFELDKHPKNPILSPVPGNTWEDEAVFNPAAFYEDGKVYLIYRAVGHDYISVLGYAESRDGLNFKKRLTVPIFTGSETFDTKSPRATEKTITRFISGGGYGGCEDPRITKIDDKLYLVYVAFNGYSEPRLALTSILYEDFINHRFLWEKPVLISPPGIIDKSGCILPEKINGKYVIFHRIYPNILIDFVDNLNFDGKTWLQGQFKIEPRPTMWDSRKIGTGAPPIKTKAGWLMIYQAVTDNDDSKYKIGAMLLDLKDPTKVLYRSNQPIIEPTEHYENNLAKFGVVYPCGAVIVGENLLVYYGGSDSVTCVASGNLEEFLKELISGNGANLTEVKINDQ